MDNSRAKARARASIRESRSAAVLIAAISAASASMRVCIAALPLIGHVHPLRAIAMELAEPGPIDAGESGARIPGRSFYKITRVRSPLRCSSPRLSRGRFAANLAAVLAANLVANLAGSLVANPPAAKLAEPGPYFGVAWRRPLSVLGAIAPLLLLAVGPSGRPWQGAPAGASSRAPPSGSDAPMRAGARLQQPQARAGKSPPPAAHP